MPTNGRGNVAQPDETEKPFRPSAGKGLQNFFLILIFTSIPSATLILGLVLNHGSTAFHLSDLRNGYHPGPGGRGTLSLVWSCVSTIFTLIHVSVHPDIPNKQEGATSRKDGFHAVVYYIRRSLSLVFWPLMNIFAPSLIVLVASMEYQSARGGVDSMRDFSERRWMLRHAFFADMGGFELEHKPVLTGRDFCKHVKGKKLDLDYDKIQEEIRDRSHTSTMFKVLTFLQASWFIAQSIVRGIEQRAISQLEVTTCAYIFSLMVAYLFWIRKPYRVSGRIPLEHMLKTQQCPICDHPIPSFIPSLSPPSPAIPVQRNPANAGPVGGSNDVGNGDVSPSQQSPTRPPLNGRPSSRAKSSYYTIAQSPLSFLPTHALRDSEKPSDSTSEDARFTPFNRETYYSDSAWTYSCFTSGVVCTLIGLIHLLPFWNRDYANPMGKSLWRICGIIQITLSLGLATSAAIERIDMLKRLHWSLWIVMSLMAFAYCVSRFVIFTLIWYSFSSLPDAVYDSIDWSWFPHWY